MEKVVVRWSCKLLESLDIRFCSRTDQRLTFLVRFIFPFLPLTPSLEYIFRFVEDSCEATYDIRKSVSTTFPKLLVSSQLEILRNIQVSTCVTSIIIIPYFNPRSHLFIFSANPHIIAIACSIVLWMLFYIRGTSEFLPLVQGLGEKLLIFILNLGPSCYFYHF